MLPRLLGLAALITLLAACGSNDSPSTADIRAAFEQDLPGILQLKDFSLEQHRNTGTPEQPVWVGRVVANVATREATFDIDTVEEGMRILKPVHAAGAGFALYGTVRSERMGESWRHGFQRDGSSNPVLGRPRTDYGPDALIAGSPEANALLKRIEQQREQERIEHETRLAEEAAERRKREEAIAEQRRREEAMATAKRRWQEEAAARHGAAFSQGGVGQMAQGDSANFLVAGRLSGGRVYGTDIYSRDSDLTRVVVHAGLLQNGEMGIVEVVGVGHQQNFRGSPRNGVDSENYNGSYPGYSVRLLERFEHSATD